MTIVVVVCVGDVIVVVGVVVIAVCGGVAAGASVEAETVLRVWCG